MKGFKGFFVALGLVLLACAAVLGQGQGPAGSAEWLPIGARVGSEVPLPSESPGTYDPVGHRDPFVSLVAPKKGSAAPAPAKARAGLAGVVLADVSVRGIVQNGRNTFAVLEGPGGKSFVARSRDRLLDATVKSIDAESVTFVQQVVNVLGESRARDVRKSLRQITTEVDR